MNNCAKSLCRLEQKAPVSTHKCGFPGYDQVKRSSRIFTDFACLARKPDEHASLSRG
jgi:hypothetical protein